MSGSKILNDDERREMLENAKHVQRGKVFMAAQIQSHEGSNGLRPNISFSEKLRSQVARMKTQKVLA